MDFSVNTLTVLIQLCLTSRLLKWFGVGFTLVLMPALSGLGFLAIGYAPILVVLAIFQVVRRSTGFALLRPAREILFTVLRREDKYKAKSVIDTFGYRLGDIVGAWSYKALHVVGLSLNAISFIAVPIIAAWCVLSVWLARKQRALADAQHRSEAGPAVDVAAAKPA
jgi:AAA family ATP:ADP antiporter